VDRGLDGTPFRITLSTDGRETKKVGVPKGIRDKVELTRFAGIAA